jgi:hypothetical protein
MDNQIIWGCVSADGTEHSGAGFKVDSETNGMYVITYSIPFDGPPAVVLTQNYKNWNQFGFSAGDTRDNAVLVASDEAKFKVKVGDSKGNGVDRNFTFIAIGPAKTA